jgi:homogentisate 1,2-dioxygenase
MAKQPIPWPHSEGECNSQAHADVPSGTYERELGREGFFGPATQMLHRHPPTGWTDCEGPLLPRAFDLTLLPKAADSPLAASEIVANEHVRVSFARIGQSMDHLIRNGDGDLLLFVHRGDGALLCDYGRLGYSEGDYLLLPRGTMWRLVVEHPTDLLCIEATNDSYGLPERGLVGRHAPFDPAVLVRPTLDAAFRAQQDESQWKLRVKRRGVISTITYPFNPLDAVGWHGDLSPARLNWRDIRPLMSHRMHLPPSAHTTFVAERFVVCTFVPRPIESDPGALKVPFFHNNDDYDEMIFYHKGEFFSRDHIHPGMLTLHPAGLTHGPHPKALAIGERAERSETDEVAVMIDTRDALDVMELPESLELHGYKDSWKPAESTPKPGEEAS